VEIGLFKDSYKSGDIKIAEEGLKRYIDVLCKYKELNIDGIDYNQCRFLNRLSYILEKTAVV